MVKIFSFLPNKIIEYSFYLLFFLVPLILTPFNYELFEYNKMMATYALTVIIIGMWLIKMAINRKAGIVKTPLDIPLLLFFLSQVVSTIFSIDRHVSIWGYYSRFNGGLLSTISYILLYYAFVTNFPKEKIKKLLVLTLSSATLVSLYGTLEHFGIDKNIWVQDVQNRVFSTLGQPNWLAAYLAVLIPITIGLTLNKFSNSIGLPARIATQSVAGGLGYLVIWLLFYVTLLFTKSRSGFLGFGITNVIFWILLFIKYKKEIIKALLIFNFSLLIFNFIFGAPFEQINRFTLPELLKNQSSLTKTSQDEKPTKSYGSSVIDVGITESGTIRQIVWKGAINIFRHYPLFGTGVETFAFSYYQFRPIEHNMTSEWDFLYNKAHNEYLNFAANSGIFGLGSYLLLILGFIWWNIRSMGIRNQESGIRNCESENTNNQKFLIHNSYFLIPSLFTGWLSILITNYFGFSVVIIQLLFFLIPAISFMLITKANNKEQITENKDIRAMQYIFISGVFLVICYLLFVICRLWYADMIFTTGYNAVRSQDYVSAYQSLKKAITLNKNEPLYYDEFSYPAAMLAMALSDDKQATLSAQIKEEAILASNIATTISPQNVNFWKTQTRVYFALYQIDPKYLSNAALSLEKARSLSPTDPKITYNLALIYDKMERRKEAIELLAESVKLKPDYRDAYFALALFYERDKQTDKAKEMLRFILEKINPSDEDAKKKLEELK